MAFELDHLFICTSSGAPEGDRLLDLGLSEGPSNTHPGQGTANRRFFFHNAMVELVYLIDEKEATSELVRPTMLYERCLYREMSASPFGLIFRPQSSVEADVPFETWDYRPPYLPPPMALPIGVNSRIKEEPFIVWMPFRASNEAYLAHSLPYLNHRIGLQRISHLRVTVAGVQKYSKTLQTVERSGLAVFVRGEEPLMEITFDEGAAGSRVDFRPELPVIFRW